MTGHFKVRDEDSEIRVYQAHVYTISTKMTQ